jgi:hypothetical protein
VDPVRDNGLEAMVEVVATEATVVAAVATEVVPPPPPPPPLYYSEDRFGGFLVGLTVNTLDLGLLYWHQAKFYSPPPPKLKEGI